MSGLDDIDWDLLELIDDLVGSGDLEEGTKEYGIAQQVVHQGYESLSPKQRYVFDKNVARLLKERAEERYWEERAASAAP